MSRTRAEVRVDLPAPGAPVMPTVVAVPPSGYDRRPDLTGLGTAALDHRQQPGQRTAVAVTGGGEQRCGVVGAPGHGDTLRQRHPGAVLRPV